MAPTRSEEIAGGGTRTLTGLASLRIFVPLWLSPPLRFVVWTFPWPWVSPLGLSRQVSTPSPAPSLLTPLPPKRGRGVRSEGAGAWLGIAATIAGRAAVPPTSTEFTRRVSRSGAQIAQVRCVCRFRHSSGALTVAAASSRYKPPQASNSYLPWTSLPYPQPPAAQPLRPSSPKFSFNSTHPANDKWKVKSCYLGGLSVV